VKLTEKQKRFADYYIETGNATESAIRAGYSQNTATETGYENLRKPHIKEYIEERNKALESDRIANMEEVKTFWTNTMRNGNADLKDRLKASEYIAKTNAAFIEKQEVDSKMSITIEGDVKEWAK
jgi:phage terminase small subunit